LGNDRKVNNYIDLNFDQVKRQRQQWDDLARTMPDILPAASTQYYRQREIALIQHHFGSLRGKKILKLDLWNEAVNTRILNWMDDQGADTYGLDISHITASRARHNSLSTNGRLRILQSDIRFLPFANNSFDFVYTMGTIEHVEEYEIVLQEIRRVLKIRGRTIIGVPHKWDIFLRPLLVKVLDLLGKYLYAPEKSMGASELKRIVERSDLRVRCRTGLLLMPGFVRLADLYFYTRGIPLHKFIPLLLWPFEQLERRWEWTRKLGYLLVVVADKSG
jgi:SAM-dependent methyltransferase